MGGWLVGFRYHAREPAKALSVSASNKDFSDEDVTGAGRLHNR